VASLLELLLDTMPFAGASGAIYREKGKTARQGTVGALGKRITYIPPEGILKLVHKSDKVMHAPPSQGKGGDEGAGQGAGDPGSSSQDAGQGGAAQGGAASDDGLRRSSEIWGFDATSGMIAMDEITCQVAGDSFQRYRVLDSVEFGSDTDDGGFERLLRVRFEGDKLPIDLPIDDASCFLRFLVKDGIQDENHHWLWPLAALHERAVMWVFVYDIELATKAVTPLQDLPEDHRDREGIRKLLGSVERLAERSSSGEGDVLQGTGEPTSEDIVGDTLFNDDLWGPITREPMVVPVPATGAGAGAPAGPAQIRAAVARIVICCSVTFHKEGDDFTPGSPAWAARFHPHIMARCTWPIAELSAAVRFVRPPKTIIEGTCGCSEMNPEMSSLLVADTNAGNYIMIEKVPVIGTVPPPMFWNNLFNYYMVDPFKERGGAAIQVVDRLRVSEPRTFHGAIARYGDPAAKVTRRARQATFDNVHVAPTMAAPPVDKVWRFNLPPGASSAPHPLAESDRESWHLDKIWMAPICAHDCFHMHWRWTDSVNDRSAFGFSGGKPYAAPGATMVPENQDVFIRFQNAFDFVYRVTAYDCPADQWQVVVHHGAAYVTEVKPWFMLVRDRMSLAFQLNPTQFGHGLKAVNEWSTFYWNMRWCLDSNAGPARERVVIVDWDLLVSEGAPPVKP